MERRPESPLLTAGQTASLRAESVKSGREVRARSPARGRLRGCRLECAGAGARGAASGGGGGPTRRAGLLAAESAAWKEGAFPPGAPLFAPAWGRAPATETPGLTGGQLQQVGCGAGAPPRVKFPEVWRAPRAEGAPAKRPRRPDAETRRSAGDPRPSFLAGILQPCAAPRCRAEFGKKACVVVEIRNRQTGDVFGQLLAGEMETRKRAGRVNWERGSLPSGNVSASLSLSLLFGLCLILFRVPK